MRGPRGISRGLSRSERPTFVQWPCVCVSHVNERVGRSRALAAAPSLALRIKTRGSAGASPSRSRQARAVLNDAGGRGTRAAQCNLFAGRARSPNESVAAANY